MYLPRLTFHALPGRIQEVEERLMTLLGWVTKAGGLRTKSDAHSLWLLERCGSDLRTRSRGSGKSRVADQEGY
jgi:hypothetical protein